MTAERRPGTFRAALRRSRTVHALAGLDLSVPEGIVEGLLGPNGAGETTVVEVLTTLIAPDARTARTDRVDMVADPTRPGSGG